MFGTSCFALGIAMVIAVLSLSATSWTFVIPMVVAGIGMGATFAPMVTLAMRDVQPAMAGSASGFINTVRQVGGALGGAVGGAILGNAVAAQLPVQARQVSARLSPAFRAKFVGAFEALSRKPQSFGPGQSTTAQFVVGLPASVAAHIAALGKLAFSQAFLEGMHPSMIAAVVVLASTVVMASALRPGRTAAQSMREGTGRPVEAAV